MPGAAGVEGIRGERIALDRDPGEILRHEPVQIGLPRADRAVAVVDPVRQRREDVDADPAAVTARGVQRLAPVVVVHRSYDARACGSTANGWTSPDRATGPYRETVGTGIGLALVAAMKGRVEVRNCTPGAELRVPFAAAPTPA